MRLWMLNLGLIFVALTAVACISDQTLQGGDPYVPGEQPEELGPTTVQDDFIQRAAVASDILFAVDDSCSMSEEQQSLSNNFSYFSQFIINSGLDFHVGVLRLDLSQNVPGQLVGTPPFIDNTTPDPVSSFVNRVQSLGGNGSGSCESGMAACYRALTPPMINGYNSGFFRETAGLTVVLVSDEDEQAGTNCGIPEAAPTEWVTWLLGLKDFNADLINLGVIAGYNPSDNVTPSSCNGAGGNAASADEYDIGVRLYEQTTGRDAITWSICDGDWSTVMTELGLAAAGLSRQFNLSRTPVRDYNDFDTDGNTEEPLLEIWMDRQDGDGFQLVEPIWHYGALDQTEIDCNLYNCCDKNCWGYDRAQNSILFNTSSMPDESWLIKANYPTGESN